MCWGHVVQIMGSGFAIYKTNTIKNPWLFYGFSLCLFHGIIGLVKFFKTHRDFDKIMNIIEVYHDINLQGIFNTELYLQLNYSPEIAYIYSIASALPFLADYIGENLKLIIDGLIIFNTASGIYASIKYDRPFAGSLSILMYANHFHRSEIMENYNLDKNEVLAAISGVLCFLIRECI